MAVELIAFDDWVRSIFDRPSDSDQWFWDDDLVEPPPEQAVAHLGRLFTTAGDWSSA